MIGVGLVKVENCCNPPLTNLRNLLYYQIVIGINTDVSSNI